ncbi:MAG: hypothetical protein KAV99_01180, partial [Candidatus Latescibacteria bacterium]|nr:hypothetical protein [Candidatus Latescibacterota bacterium]
MSLEKRYHRRSIRLNGCDYSQPGAYFITICVQKYQCLLTAEPVREMVHNAWQELSNRFGHVALDEFV